MIVTKSDLCLTPFKSPHRLNKLVCPPGFKLLFSFHFGVRLASKKINK